MNNTQYLYKNVKRHNNDIIIIVYNSIFLFCLKIKI